jgi:hypothetical protein
MPWHHGVWYSWWQWSQWQDWSQWEEPHAHVDAMYGHWPWSRTHDASSQTPEWHGTLIVPVVVHADTPWGPVDVERFLEFVFELGQFKPAQLEQHSLQEPLHINWSPWCVCMHHHWHYQCAMPFRSLAACIMCPAPWPMSIHGINMCMWLFPL